MMPAVLQQGMLAGLQMHPITGRMDWAVHLHGQDGKLWPHDSGSVAAEHARRAAGAPPHRKEGL